MANIIVEAEIEVDESELLEASDKSLWVKIPQEKILRVKTNCRTYYNKRTWLNKNSPSLGNVAAYDGNVNYSDGTERTTFLAISDCNRTIKLIKNTESIQDFIDKIKLLKNEIVLFINHLEQTE